MTVKKQFAQGETALDECMDQLVEVLAQLLEEPQNPQTAAADNQGTAAVADLRSGPARAIHVVVNNEEK